MVCRDIVVRCPKVAPAEGARVHCASHERAPQKVDVIVALHAPVRQGRRELVAGQLVGSRPLIPPRDVDGPVLEDPTAKRHHGKLHHVRPGAGQREVGGVVVAVVVRIVEVLHAEKLAHDAVRRLEFVLDKEGASQAEGLVYQKVENVVEVLEGLALGLLPPVVEEHPPEDAVPNGVAEIRAGLKVERHVEDALTLPTESEGPAARMREEVMDGQEWGRRAAPRRLPVRRVNVVIHREVPPRLPAGKLVHRLLRVPVIGLQVHCAHHGCTCEDLAAGS
mmetsp:Transcript_21508/g.64584  ORF Transcript_21508/g.64584 Transcript_21508/m.64584 type:complete len:278 (-) Transcript_21508:217-1050(-)